MKMKYNFNVNKSNINNQNNYNVIPYFYIFCSICMANG